MVTFVLAKKIKKPLAKVQMGAFQIVVIRKSDILEYTLLLILTIRTDEHGRNRTKVLTHLRPFVPSSFLPFMLSTL
jgi:hypothetical protein